MPYEYRKLNLTEREELVDARSRQGYLLDSSPHAYDLGGCFLVTTACFVHAAIMDAENRRAELQERLLGELPSGGVVVHGWVVLPNHYHVLIEAARLEQVSAVLKHVHGVTSRYWNALDGLTGKRRVWYKYAERMIRNEAHYCRALN